MIVNNDSGQDVGAWAAARGFERVKVVEAGWNSGFCAGNNRGVRESAGEFVFFCNNDLVVTPTYLCGLARFLDHHPRAGAAAGKLLRYDLASRSPVDRFDSAGIVLRRNRGAFDRGENQPDTGQYDASEQVFGVSAAGMVVRRAALDDVAPGAAFFDENLFMYKEDVDAGWRLGLRGWESWYVPAAVAYHARTSQGLAGRAYMSDIRGYLSNERRKPVFVRMHSLKNQWLLLLKHESASTFIADFPWIAGREALALASALYLSPPTVARALAGFAKAAPRALAERRRLRRSAIVSPADIRLRWVRR